jgi:CRP-like cAMP-binding protein
VFIVEGRVRVHRTAILGETELHAGDALGTLSLVVEGPRMTSAETLSRTRLLRLRADAFRRVAAEAPTAACALLEALVREAAHALRAQADALMVDRNRASD